ncbi:hypothetical protein EC988_005685 [Linderina pennispora]|nr:hypothetical protein EC988_005685 [Linderina pennispora]
MKFAAAAVLALVAAVNAADSSAAGLDAIANLLPSDLLAIVSYLPSDVIQDALADGKLPTDIASVLSRATGIPTSLVPALSSEYAQLLAQMGGGEASATPTAPAASSGATPAASHAASHTGSHAASDLDSLDEEESSHASHSGSAAAPKPSAEKSGNGAAKVAGSLAAAALAAAALF